MIDSSDIKCKPSAKSLKGTGSAHSVTSSHVQKYKFVQFEKCLIMSFGENKNCTHTFFFYTVVKILLVQQNFHL